MSETPQETIARLTAERDLAREECGHHKAMRKSVTDEFYRYINRTLAEKRAAGGTEDQ